MPWPATTKRPTWVQAASICAAISESPRVLQPLPVNAEMSTTGGASAAGCEGPASSAGGGL